MAIRDEFIIEQLLYQVPSGQRFVQDSPVIPELWKAFARNPKEKQEVLITPHRNMRTGMVAKRMRETIARMQEEEPDRADKFYNLSEIKIAPLSSQVAITLDFPTLMELVIPLTTWWWSMMRIVPKKDFGAKSKENFIRQLATELTGRQEQRGLPSALIWLAQMAGTIHLSTQDSRFPYRLLLLPLPHGNRRYQNELREQARSVASAFFHLMPNFAFNILWERHANFDFSKLNCIHRVTRNRRVELAVNKSTKAIKADAARRLFDISCGNVTWAVIDSGIDIEHDAFKDHIGGGSRVDAVYDFTILRELNNLDAVKAALNDRRKNYLLQELKRRQPSSQEAEMVIRILTAHCHRLEAGDDIDYNLIEPFLRDFNPTRPTLAHGTHVAGILGADWRDCDARVMTGVCPDIRLIDMRVMRSDGNSNEFEVISALEFLRHHNDRLGCLAIKGANLSLSIDNDLRGGDACGRTPVCDECERTVSAGVCVVVAAGNNGSANILRHVNSAWQEMWVYMNASITDPGNADSVITVGATHCNRPHEYGVSFFSSRGPTGDGRNKPDLVAPGERILVPAPNQDKYDSDGTSLAAPHISGAAALIMARNAELIGQPHQIKKILCDTATDLKREVYYQGAGLVDVLRALQSV